MNNEVNKSSQSKTYPAPAFHNIPTRCPPEAPVATASAAVDHIMTAIESKHAQVTVESAPVSSSSAKGGNDLPAHVDVASTVVDAADVNADGEPIKKRSTLRLTFILLALFLSLFVAALDAMIVATAVPVITHELHSASGYTWIGGAYLIANAVASPIWAKFSDIWGRKTIMLTAVAIFAASSLVCATAQTMRALIVGRALQGTAGGGLILLVHVVISDLFSMRKRSLWMGVTEAVWATAGGAGPPLGGVFASLVSWRWCFYINLPICGTAFALLLFFLDVKHGKTGLRTGLKAVDWWGIVSFLAFTLLILLGLDFGGGVFEWDSAKVIALIVVGVCMIGAFIYSEAKLARYPLIPLDLFKDRSNLAAVGVGFFHGMAFIPGEYYIPLYLQGVMGQSPVKSGVSMIPFMVITAGTGVLTGVIIHKTGRFRELIWVGTCFLCLGIALFSILDVGTSLGELIGLTLIVGCGSGMLFEPPLIAVQSRTKQENMAMATSSFCFCRNVALAISIVIGGVVFQNSMDGQADYLRSSGLPADIVELLSGKEAAANVAIGSSLSNLAQREAVEHAIAMAMRNMWILYSVIAGLAILSGLLVGKAILSKEHTETVTGIKVEKVKTTNNIEMV